MPDLNFDLTTNNENEVLSKREPTSAVMQLQMEIPGSKILADGSHTIGFLESNIVITKVSLVVRKAFDGTLPVVSIRAVQSGVTENWLADEDLSAERVHEALLTAPTVAGKSAPFYQAGKGEWFADVVSGNSTVGEFALLVDYVQLDTEPGKHS